MKLSIAVMLSKTDLSQWGIDIVANLLSNPSIFSVTDKKEGGYISTLGPKGVAEICAIVGAKSCLPYGDSWAELGYPSLDDKALIQEVATELRNLGCSTTVVPWKIGDGYVTNGAQVPGQAATPFYSTLRIDHEIPSQTLLGLLMSQTLAPNTPSDRQKQIRQVQGQYHGLSLYVDTHQMIATALALLALS